MGTCTCRRRVQDPEDDAGVIRVEVGPRHRHDPAEVALGDRPGPLVVQDGEHGAERLRLPSEALGDLRAPVRQERAVRRRQQVVQQDPFADHQEDHEVPCGCRVRPERWRHRI